MAGNPPYNDSNNGNIPIYGDFVKKALELSDKLSFIIPSSFALSDERNGNKIRKLVFGPHTSQVEFLPNDTFENVDVETLSVTIDMTKTHNTKIISRTGESYTTTDYEYIFEDKMLYDILKKCKVSNSDASWIKFNRMEKSKKCENEIDTVTTITPNEIVLSKTNTLDKFVNHYRVVTSFLPNSPNHIDVSYVVSPSIAVKDGYTVSLCDTQEEAENLSTFLKTKLAMFIYKKTKTSRTLRTPQLKFIPKIDLSKKWSNDELYEHFDLIQEERNYIEANVK
jgi:site-specific DNA-methyltransferase (adenine-specific)